MHAPHLSYHPVFQLRKLFMFLQIPFSMHQHKIWKTSRPISSPPHRRQSPSKTGVKRSPSIAAGVELWFDVKHAYASSGVISRWRALLTPAAIDGGLLRLSCLAIFCGGVGVKSGGIESKCCWVHGIVYLLATWNGPQAGKVGDAKDMI